jgi:hypothetical protein
MGCTSDLSHTMTIDCMHLSSHEVAHSSRVETSICVATSYENAIFVDDILLTTLSFYFLVLFALSPAVT